MSGRGGSEVISILHQAHLGDAWDNASIAVTVIDDSGAYIACNEAMCRLSGYSRAELLDMRAGRTLAVDPELNRRIFENIVSGRQTANIGGLRRKDGKELDVAVLGVPTRVAGLEYYVVLYWPLDERPVWGPGRP